jgi:hypothetical protein
MERYNDIVLTHMPNIAYVRCRGENPIGSWTDFLLWARERFGDPLTSHMVFDQYAYQSRRINLDAHWCWRVRTRFCSDDVYPVAFLNEKDAVETMLHWG